MYIYMYIYIYIYIYIYYIYIYILYYSQWWFVESDQSPETFTLVINL